MFHGLRILLLLEKLITYSTNMAILSAVDAIKQFNNTKEWTKQEQPTKLNIILPKIPKILNGERRQEMTRMGECFKFTIDKMASCHAFYNLKSLCTLFSKCHILMN